MPGEDREQPSLELPSLFRRKAQDDGSADSPEPAPPPVEQVEPAPRPVEPAEPTEPTELVEPAEPTEVVEPVEVVEVVEPAEVVATPRLRRTLPRFGALPAAVLTGVLVGLLAVGLAWLTLRACNAVKGTTSCGQPGLLVLLAIFVVMVLAGRVLLAALKVRDPGSTSFLASALMSVLALVFLSGSIHDRAAAVILPVLGAVTFALARWVTATFVEPGDRPR